MFSPRQAKGIAEVARDLAIAVTVICLCAFAASASALTLSPSSVSLAAGTYTTVKISGASGEIQAETANTAITTVSLSSVTTTTATLTVFGKAAGSTVVYVRDARTSNIRLPVAVTASMTVSPTSLSLSVGATGRITASNYSGTVSASSANSKIATVSVSANVLTVRAIASGSTLVTVKDRKSTINVPVTVLASTGSATSARYSLIAWNDLGMHCMDGKDYSLFSILPPYNNLHAQLVNASTGRTVTTGVTLTYQAVADPTGSINTGSAGKTNFWTYAAGLYGASPAPDVGLTGNASPSLLARAMALDPANLWFEATGLPITPYADQKDSTGAFVKNYYPTVRVTARDSSGKVLASTTTVLPVSDEITCVACHASTTSTANPARLAAMPRAGWAFDTDPERDWKENILKLHDERQGTGLLPAALNGKPTLCAACHGSNALPGTGVVGVSALTSALHSSHGKVIDPATVTATSAGMTLDESTNRGSCYNCHPGSVTRCLRGAMGDAVDSAGNATMGCQSCHGNMTKVGDPLRLGWLQQPNCQACHFDGKRTLSALDASGRLVAPADSRFATNPNTPGTNLSLFRFSKGHGGVQCEACHGATHAEYPSSHSNDNLQSIALQGYAGTLRECTTCHVTVPMSATGGPHGMHTIGASWVGKHEGYVESAGPAQCAYCHGSDYKGSPLAQMKASRTFTSKTGGTRSYVAGQTVGCFDCHNGPGG